MAHCVIPEAEAILDKEYRVLDKGFVRLVDYLGGDSRIVQAARVSYAEGTKTYRDDKNLIDHLLRNRHTSPFEQVILTFHVKLPIFVARQWIRHRTARLNEISGRYSVMRDEFFLPEPKDIALQSADNRQGRAESLPADKAERILREMESQQRETYERYTSLIAEDVAREIARINLPLSLYTEWYWQIDLNNLFHFLSLRLDDHAQKEIRDYARVLLDIARAVAPLACASFENHVLGGVSFSAEERAALEKLLKGEESGLTGKIQDRFAEKLRSGRQL